MMRIYPTRRRRPVDLLLLINQRLPSFSQPHMGWVTDKGIICKASKTMSTTLARSPNIYLEVEQVSADGLQEVPLCPRVLEATACGRTRSHGSRVGQGAIDYLPR